MEKQAYGKKTVALCAVSLSIIAAAAFFAMNAFTRPVFGNVWQWQLSFAVMAVCLLLSAAFRRPLVSLGIAAAAAAAMGFVTPFYAGLFFPVALQAALWEAAKERKDAKSGTAAFWTALLLVPVSGIFRIRLWRFMEQNSYDFSSGNSIGEACLCCAGLFLLLALWVWLFVKSFRAAHTDKKTPAKKRGRAQKKANGGNRLPAVYVVCTVNAAASLVSCLQLFSGNYVKLLLFAHASFVLYLLFRREPTLLGWAERCRRAVVDGTA